jgi:hypothetical protein
VRHNKGQAAQSSCCWPPVAYNLASPRAWEPAGDKWKRVFIAIDEDGNKINQTGTIAWDGKDHATEKPGITVAHKVT